MTPAARVQTAIELLDDILGGAPAEKVLTAWARRSRFAGSRDRAAVRDHVFDGLRRRNSAAAMGGGLTGRGGMLGLLRQQGADLDAIFSGANYAPEPLSDAERAPAVCDLPLDVPEWLVAPMRAGLGADFDSALSAMRNRAPVGLRVNLRKTTRVAAIARLSEDGVSAVPCDLADTALIVDDGARRVGQSRAYAEGWIELQDVSSQAAVASLPLRDGMRVLDYCAGGGGKLLAMAARIDGAFNAYDALPGRMRDLPARALRAGIRARVLSDPGADAPYDLVFCDVPCSGSGTWRRNPDAMWRFHLDDLRRIQGEQAEILNSAAALVAENGVLVYATCSVLRSENIEQIQLFLERSSGWRVVAENAQPIRPVADGFFHTLLTRE